MEKIKNSNFENSYEVSATAEAFENIKPGIISKFRPNNAEQAKADFLNDDSLEKPDNNYSDFTRESVDALGDSVEVAILALQADEALGPVERRIYEGEIESKAKIHDFLQAGVDYREAETAEDKAAAAERYGDLNREIYGAPERDTFESLLGEKLSKISEKKFDERGEEIKRELFESLNGDYLGENSSERFKPSDETFARFGRGVRLLFGEQLAKVPEAPRDGDKFSAEEIVEVFENVIADFEGKTDFSHFDVVWKDSGAIAVNTDKRQISVSRNRASVSREKLEGLVAHEVCTHYFRAQTGEAYGVTPLRKGLSGYLDTEEGIARAMEMAVDGKYEEAGVPHYITAGLVEFEGKNYRETFEAKWRLGVLESSKTGEISDEDISKAKNLAYTQTQRIFRGTDELPWYKDLSYYNGGQKIWRYIEENINDPWLFDNLLLGGKSNVLDENHERNLYELKTGGIG